MGQPRFVGEAERVIRPPEQAGLQFLLRISQHRYKDTQNFWNDKQTALKWDSPALSHPFGSCQKNTYL